MSDETYLPNVRDDVQYRELEDGGVIYDTESERIHTLNLTAAYIWNSCDGSRTVSDIASELHRHVSVSPEQALNDVLHAITYFKGERLLRFQ